jgi:tryptophan synthase alpha chain
MGSLREVLSHRRRQGKASLLAYLMAGSVDPARWADVVDTLVSTGIQGLEVGFPFSDPMAEGPVIQKAASASLSRGYRWSDLLDTLRSLSGHVPLAVMTYLNPILQRGVERAYQEMGQAGGSALILPDLPLEEAGPFRRAGRLAGVDTVLLASPATGPERLRRLVRSTEAFLYVVSRYGTTGAESGETPSTHFRTAPLAPLLRSAREVRRGLPLLVGFGVSRPEDVRRYLEEGADGVVVGSAFQSRMMSDASPSEIGRFAQGLLEALESAPSPPGGPVPDGGPVGTG